jgi:D-glycero-D-manno-heptose 1,7-bisphosphate phosphatase
VVKLAILDRDGTLIDVVRDEEAGAVVTAFHPDHIRFLPGVLDGLHALQGAGFTLAIATNQPGPAKGQITAAAVSRTNQALVEKLAAAGITIAAIEVCLHKAEDDCDCRKPKPGMLRTLLANLDGDPAGSWMIGDNAADIDAGRAAGLRTGLVFASNRCELCPLREGPHSTPDLHAPTLAALAEAILHRS